MAGLPDDVDSAICYRGIRITSVQWQTSDSGGFTRWVTNPSFSQGRESCRLNSILAAAPAFGRSGRFLEFDGCDLEQVFTGQVSRRLR
jgi:hypothetical protein